MKEFEDTAKEIEALSNYERYDRQQDTRYNERKTKRKES
jgi:hypothetical protein